MPGKEPNELTSIPNFDEVLLKAIDNSETLEELGSNTLRLLMARRNIPMRQWNALSIRFSWLSGSGTTLQEAANQIGVTRERLRQIQEKLKPLEIDLLVAPKVFYKVMGVLKRTNDQDSFIEELVQQSLILPTNPWSIDSISELASIFNVPKFKAEFEAEFRKLIPVAIALESRQTIQRTRNALGLIDLEILASKLNTNTERAADAAEEVYQYVYRHNNLLLTTTRLPGMFLNTVGKQLIVSNNLTLEDVQEGIRRKAFERGTPLVGDIKDINALIEMFAGNPPRFSNLPLEVREGSSLGNLEEWLRQVFRESPYGVLHRDQLSEKAFKEGISQGSLGAFLTYSVIVRPVIPSMFALVGQLVDEETVLFLKKSVIAQSEDTIIEWEIQDNDNLILSIVPNATGFANGSFMVEKELREMMSGYEFEPKCSCGQVSTKSTIKVVPSKFWTGFAPQLQHYRKTHDWVEGERIRIRFKFSSRTATLLIE
jgi:hypothetical protein